MTTTKTLEERIALLETMSLESGPHATPDDGMCAMETVAWLAGEAHSDAPACACPVISRAIWRLNDRISDEAMRTELLRPLLPRIIGSRASRDVMVKRGFVAADMAVRVFAPMVLESRGKLDLAKSLRGARPIVDRETALAGRDLARAAAYAYASAAADAAAAAYAYASSAAAAADADAYASAAYAYAADAADAYAYAYASASAAYADAAAAAYAYASAAADDAAAAYAYASAAAAAADADASAAAADAADAYAYAYASASDQKKFYEQGVVMIERMLAIKDAV